MTPRRRARLAILAIATIVMASGCDEPSPFAAERLHDIARREGTAVGESFSGLYGGYWIARSCECPPILDDVAISGCVEGAERYIPQMKLIQSDGAMLLAAGGWYVNGGIDADGAFEVAAIINGTTFGTRGHSGVYLAGEIVQEPSLTVLRGDFYLHIAGEVAVDGLGDAIDCVDHYAVYAPRTAAFAP